MKNLQTMVLNHSALLVKSLCRCSVLLLLNCANPDLQDDVTARIDVRLDAGGHEVLARSLALSLADPEVRQEVHAAFGRSLHEEGKVHFRTFLEADEGRALRAAMVDSLGSEEALEAELDRTVELEFYVPFPKQRADWRGGDDLLVATLLDDDSLPIGFALDGVREELDPMVPPDTTAISLVPAESFDRAGHLYNLPPTPAGLTYEQSGLWADYVELADLAEPAYKGYPEIEVFIFNMATKKKVICASQASTKPFAWDLNSSPYKVPFLMATPQQLVQGNSYILAVVEDDGDLCVLDTTKDQVGPALTKARSVNKKAAALMAPGPSWIASWTSNVTYEYSYRASDPDDFIGVAVEGLTVNAKPVPIYLMSTALSPIGNIIVSWTKRVVTVP